MAAQPRTRKRWYIRNPEGYLFLMPDFVGFSVFVFLPVIAALILGFFAWNGLQLDAMQFVGFQNYEDLFTKDPYFPRILWNTTYYVLGTVPVRAFLALLLAIALNQKLRGMYFWRTAFFMPTLSSAVAVALVWRWIFNSDFGILNSFLFWAGVPEPPRWLDSTVWAMPALILMSIWQGLGFQTIIFLAGLQGIPQHLYEAASIDGADAFDRFWHITVPMISPTTFFVLVTSVIGSYQVFESALILNEGGPAYATTTIVYYIYTNGFQFFKMGYAAAIAEILFAIIFAFTMLQFYFQKRWVHYD